MKKIIVGAVVFFGIVAVPDAAIPANVFCTFCAFNNDPGPNGNLTDDSNVDLTDCCNGKVFGE